MHLIRALVPRELHPVAVEEEENAVRVNGSTGEVLKLELRWNPAPPFPLDRFEILLMRTPFVAEREITVLKSGGPKKVTLGYVFPVSALDPMEDSLEDGNGEALEEEKWKILYADVASRGLLSSDVPPRHVFRTEQIDQPIVTSLSYIARPDICVAVVGREQMAEVGLTTSAVEFALIGSGFLPLDGVGNAPPAIFPGVVRVLVLPRELLEQEAALFWLLGRYAWEPNQAARFLGLYQLIEMLIARQYDREIAALVGDPGVLRDPWKLKEKLNTAAGEIGRLRRVLGEHCPGFDHGLTAELKRVADRFLTAHGNEAPESDWASSLYAVRNIVVHRQLLLAANNGSELHDCCEALLQVVMNAARTFDYPSPAGAIEDQGRTDVVESAVTSAPAAARREAKVLGEHEDAERVGRPGNAGPGACIIAHAKRIWALLTRR